MRFSCRAVFVGLMALGGTVFSVEAAGWHGKHDMTRPVCGPWLQNASETTMSVSWITEVPCAVAIEYRAKGDKDWTRQWETLGDKLLYTRDLHTFHLKGLKPGTDYEYRLLSSLSRYDQAYTYTRTFVGRDVYSFRTFDPNRKSYSVFLTCDIHGDFRDIGEQVYRRFNVGKCDFVAFLGDQVDDNMNQARYYVVDGYLDAVSRLWGATKPSVFVRGNHDCWGAPAAQAWVDYHGHPDGVSYYSFSHGPVLYVVLDNPHDYSNASAWKASDAAGEVRAAFLARQFDWFQGLVKSEDWKRATFRVVLCHYAVRLGASGFSEQLKSHYKSFLNGRDGIHLFVCGHEHFAASALPGEVGFYHNARKDNGKSKPPVYKSADGSFDFVEVCGDMHGCMLLDVAKDKLTIRIGDRKEGAPDLDCLEICPDKTAKRLPCPEK